MIHRAATIEGRHVIAEGCSRQSRELFAGDQLVRMILDPPNCYVADIFQSVVRKGERKVVLDPAEQVIVPCFQLECHHQACTLGRIVVEEFFDVGFALLGPNSKVRGADLSHHALDQFVGVCEMQLVGESTFLLLQDIESKARFAQVDKASFDHINPVGECLPEIHRKIADGVGHQAAFSLL